MVTGWPQAPPAEERPTALFVIRNLLLGGAERTFVQYVNHARSMHPVVVLHERRGSLLGELRPGLRIASLRAGAAPDATPESPTPPLTVPALIREARALARLAADTDARLVSTFLMRSHVVALCAKLLLPGRWRLTLNVHEHMTDSAPYLYPRARDRLLMRGIVRFLFPRADLIVTVADGVKRDLVETFGVPKSLVRVLANPIDLDRIAAAARDQPPQPLPNPRPLLVSVGRLVHLKGYDILLRALARLPGDLRLALLLIGDGPERADLEWLAAESGLESRVTFLGRQDNPWRWVARADAFVLPSRAEASPLVLVEALALGVPVLAADCSAGVRECLGQQGEFGVLVPPNDPDALAAGLTRLLSDEPLQARLRAAGPRRAADFALPAAVRAYEAALVSVLTPTTA